MNLSRVYCLGFWEFVARNEMESGSTERRVKHQTDLTEPQGIIIVKAKNKSTFR